MGVPGPRLSSRVYFIKSSKCKSTFYNIWRTLNFTRNRLTTARRATEIINRRINWGSAVYEIASFEIVFSDTRPPPNRYCSGIVLVVCIFFFWPLAGRAKRFTGESQPAPTCPTTRLFRRHPECERPPSLPLITRSFIARRAVVYYHSPILFIIAAVVWREALPGVGGRKDRREPGVNATRARAPPPPVAGEERRTRDLVRGQATGERVCVRRTRRAVRAGEGRHDGRGPRGGHGGFGGRGRLDGRIPAKSTGAPPRITAAPDGATRVGGDGGGRSGGVPCRGGRAGYGGNPSRFRVKSISRARTARRSRRTSCEPRPTSLPCPLARRRPSKGPRAIRTGGGGGGGGGARI